MRRGTLFAQGEREVFVERLKAISRVQESGKAREDVGEWKRRPLLIIKRHKDVFRARLG